MINKRDLDLKQEPHYRTKTLSKNPRTLATTTTEKGIEADHRRRSDPWASATRGEVEDGLRT
jgi:hypothetical protein